MKELVRKRLVFHGLVQGAGFRWRTRQAALLYGCTGWCRNDDEGTVTMEIQGTEAQISQVLKSIEAGRYIWIERMDETPLYPEPGERGFETEW